MRLGSVRLGAVAFALVCACRANDDAPPPTTLAKPANGCSQLGRLVYSYEGEQQQLCGSIADLFWTELVPVGGGHFVSWVSRTGDVRMWSLQADDTFKPTAAAFWAPYSNHLVVNLGQSRVLRYDQRDGSSELLTVDPLAQGLADPLPTRVTQFSLGIELTGRAFLAIDDAHLLQWTPGDGAFKVLFIDRANERTAPLRETAFAGTMDALRRGHEWAALGAGRLLEWVPLTGAYHVWGFDLSGAGGNPFAATPLASGAWSGLGVDHEILTVDTDKILIWNRSTGELDLRRFDPSMSDPLAGPRLSLSVDENLQSLPHGFEPPTTSRIKRVIAILQDGRSFDSYFGRWCQAPPGSAPTCTAGPACCEAMPALTDGVTTGCQAIDLQSTDFAPAATGDCLADEIDQGRMDRFVTSTLPGCGDPRNFACAVPAAPGPGVFDVGAYHALAGAGALADRFFQSFRGPAEANFLFLAHASLGPPLGQQSGEQITSQLAEQNVPFALYLPNPDQDTQGQPPPIYYDGTWSHLRHFDELVHDVELEQLAPVSAIVAPPELSERPGAGPAADGVAFVQAIVDAVLGSPRYRDETLILITHLTGGGFYDHVAPPAASSVDNIPYGPRVALLAVGPFAKPGSVSHVPLELSSITKFVEWNWFGGVVGQLHVRDVSANNLGSLLREDPDGGTVPSGPE